MLTTICHSLFNTTVQWYKQTRINYMIFHFLLDPDPELKFRIRIQAKFPDLCGSTTLNSWQNIHRIQVCWVCLLLFEQKANFPSTRPVVHFERWILLTNIHKFIYIKILIWVHFLYQSDILVFNYFFPPQFWQQWYSDCLMISQLN